MKVLFELSIESQLWYGLKGLDHDPIASAIDFTT